MLGVKKHTLVGLQLAATSSQSATAGAEQSGTSPHVATVLAALLPGIYPNGAHFPRNLAIAFLSPVQDAGAARQPAQSVISERLHFSGFCGFPGAGHENSSIQVKNAFLQALAFSLEGFSAQSSQDAYVIGQSTLPGFCGLLGLFPGFLLPLLPLLPLSFA